jgi:hypothetical protein
MIRFVCTCGHRFEVDDEMAGSSIQCPACGLLTDVPTVSDLASFTDEGTYRLDADRPVVDDPDRLADLGIIYSKHKVDEHGNEIDLRTLPGGRPKAPSFYDDEEETGELELKPVEPVEVQRPKYDPETGELIRPLDVKKDPERDVHPSSIPMAKAAITYAAGDLQKTISPGSIALELFQPMNLVVMFFIFCVHMFSGMMFVVMIAALFFLVPPFIILQALILSHYGNVIDDTGRNQTDDLPRPLRDLSWYDDIWSSFVAMFGGIMITFVVPALAVGGLLAFMPFGAPIALLVGALIGTAIGPAVLLTTNTSGSTLNLRPDRLLQVIHACGGHYFAAVALWALAWPVYLIGWWGFFAAMARSFGHEIVLVWIIRGLTGIELDDLGIFGEWVVVFPALVIGLYLMHYFCWLIGLLYKAHHAEFPWVLQRHVRDPDKLHGPRGTHADQLGRRRHRHAGHLPPPMESPLPQAPPPPPSATSRIG